MPQQQTLVLDFDDADVRALCKSRFGVVLARPAGIALPNVAWLAIPVATSCRITWESKYGLYAANVPARAGARIEVVASIHPVAEQTICRFSDGEFRPVPPDAKIPRRHYDVENASPSAAAFGLLQRAKVGGTAILSPVNAVVVPPGHSADFMAVDDIFVWLQQDAAGSAAIARAPADATKIAFSLNDAVKRYCYDPRAMAFVPSGPASRNRFACLTTSEDAP